MVAQVTEVAPAIVGMDQGHGEADVPPCYPNPNASFG